MTAPTGWPADQPLRTARLLLEPLSVRHADELAPVLDEPALHTYIGGRPAMAEELRERYAGQVVGHSADGSQLWFNWVLRETATGLAAGYLQASVFTGDDTPVAVGLGGGDAVPGTRVRRRGRGRAGSSAAARQCSSRMSIPSTGHRSRWPPRSGCPRRR